MRHNRSVRRGRARPAPVPTSNGSSEDRALSVVVAEYQYVSSLIPFYRNVEMLVLTGTGLAASGAVAAFAALTGGENPDPAVAAVVLAAAAWGPALLLVVEITALTRIARASNYIKGYLGPLARQLSDDKYSVLKFEDAPTELLVADISEEHTLARGLVRAFASSLGVLLIPVLATIGLAVGAGLVRSYWPIWVCGATASATALAAMSYGYMFTSGHERRSSEKRPTERPLRV